MKKIYVLVVLISLLSLTLSGCLPEEGSIRKISEEGVRLVADWNSPFPGKSAPLGCRDLHEGEYVRIEKYSKISLGGSIEETIVWVQSLEQESCSGWTFPDLLKK